ncbi:UNVERIFIED_CONTAM: hypothetical protein GTU68_004642 [Idotea baltica]|nr:hypothetical protein [Idotea baltica]
MGGSEQRYLQEAFDSNFIAPVGPQLTAFEEAFCKKTGFEHAVAVASGTAAIHLGLRHLGVGSGDVVLASTLTFIGSVSPIIFQGAEPVFIDCDRETWNLDRQLLAEEVDRLQNAGKRVAAVLPTDLYGQCCDLAAIQKVCEPHGIPVLVDCAESLGATYQGGSAGKGARAAAFSFNGNKIITTSGGGMLASDDEKLIEHARFLSTQAKEPEAHFEHRELGYNYRMSNLVAAVGIGQLEVLEDRVRRKREIFDYYASAFASVSGIEMMPESSKGECNRWLTVVLIHPEKFGCDRETVRLKLEEENIESRPMWKPMHQQPVFDGKRCVGGSVSEELFELGLCLPCGTALTDSELDRIIETVNRAVKK